MSNSTRIHWIFHFIFNNVYLKLVREREHIEQGFRGVKISPAPQAQKAPPADSGGGETTFWGINVLGGYGTKSAKSQAKQRKTRAGGPNTRAEPPFFVSFQYLKV